MIMGEVPVNWMQQQSIIGLSNMIPDCVEMLQNAILGDNQFEILANWIQVLPNEGVFYLYKEIMEKNVKEQNYLLIKEIICSKLRQENHEVA